MAHDPSNAADHQQAKPAAWPPRHPVSVEEYRRLAQEHQPEAVGDNGERVKVPGPPLAEVGSPRAAQLLALWRQPQPQPTK